MILYRRTGLEVHCDRGTIALLKLIAEGLECREVLDLMQKFGGVSRERATHTLERRLDMLLSVKVAACPEVHPYTSTAPHLAAVEITNVCNLSCKYCYASSGPWETSSMSLDQVTYILEEIKAVNIPLLWITGGEPLLHPAIEEVLKEATKRDFYVIIATNGVPLYDDLRKIRIVKKYVDEIQIALDGATPQTHDYYRGKGTYTKVIHVIEELTKGRRDLTVVVGTTLGRSNFREIPQIVKLMDELDVDYWVHGSLVCIGRGRFFLEECLTPEELVECYNLILKGAKMATRVKVLKTLAGVTPIEPKSIRPTCRCGAVNFQIQIHVNGDVYPCVFLRDQQFKLGNVFRQSLSEILDSPKAWYFKRDVDLEERDVYGLVSAECRECIVHKAGFCNTFCKAYPHTLYCTRDVNGSPLNKVYRSLSKA